SAGLPERPGRLSRSAEILTSTHGTKGDFLSYTGDSRSRELAAWISSAECATVIHRGGAPAHQFPPHCSDTVPADAHRQKLPAPTARRRVWSRPFAGWPKRGRSGVMTREQILPIRLTQDELRQRARTEDRALVDLIFCYLGNPVAANGECFGADELFGRSV